MIMIYIYILCVHCMYYVYVLWKVNFLLNFNLTFIDITTIQEQQEQPDDVSFLLS